MEKMNIFGFLLKQWFCNFQTGKVANATVTRNRYTWREAKHNCTMIGQEHYVNISSGTDEELWIDAKQGRCACLQHHEHHPPNNGASNPDCKAKQCENDDNGLCVDTNCNDLEIYAVYRKQVFSRNDIRAGNCLSVVENDIGGKGVKSYEAIPCDRRLFRVCQTGHKINVPTAGNDKYVWSKAFGTCSSGTLARYSVVLNQTIHLRSGEHYWLGNIRRPTFHFYSDPEPELKYCGSAKITSNGRLKRSVAKCDTRLRALCLNRQEYHDLNPDKDSPGLNVVITVVVVLAVSVILGVIVWRVRFKKKLLSLDQHHNTSEDGHVYTEINEAAECSKRPPERANEQFTYDHLNHSSKVINKPSGNIYDPTTDVPERYYDQSSIVKSSYDKVNTSQNMHGHFQNPPPNEYDTVRLIEKYDEDNYHHLDINKGNVTTNVATDYSETSFIN